MAAEYTVFVEKYMMRPVIYKDMKAGSLFASYIWENFYSNSQFFDLFKLVQHVHKFYHRCAFGTPAEHGKMVLFWRELVLFMEENFNKKFRALDMAQFHKTLKNIDFGL